MWYSAKGQGPDVELETSYQELAEVIKTKWVATCRELHSWLQSKHSINEPCWCCPYTLFLSRFLFSELLPLHILGWRRAWSLRMSSKHSRGCESVGGDAYTVITGKPCYRHAGKPCYRHARVPEFWHKPEFMKGESNGWGNDISARNALHPWHFLYLFGPPLVGEGNILSLFIAAVGQDVDDGDLVYTYGNASCEWLSTMCSGPLGLHRRF